LSHWVTTSPLVSLLELALHSRLHFPTSPAGVVGFSNISTRTSRLLASSLLPSARCLRFGSQDDSPPFASPQRPCLVHRWNQVIQCIRCANVVNWEVSRKATVSGRTILVPLAPPWGALRARLQFCVSESIPSGHFSAFSPVDFRNPCLVGTAGSAGHEGSMHVSYLSNHMNYGRRSHRDRDHDGNWLYVSSVVAVTAPALPFLFPVPATSTYVSSPPVATSSSLLQQARRHPSRACIDGHRSP
jgi:hypothetical protein